MSKRPPKTREEQQRDNRANQLNPNNDAFWWSRGLPGRPRSEPHPGHTPKGGK